MPQPSSSAERRRLLNVDGKTYTLFGEPDRDSRDPPMDRVLCTVDDSTPVIVRLQEFWDFWPDDRLGLIAASVHRRRQPPVSMTDVPDEVEAGSIREEWDFERGYCRSIRWRANGRAYLAWSSGASWSSRPDMPLGSVFWHVRCEDDDDTLDNLLGIEFEPPADWWSSKGVIRAAMDAVRSDPGHSV